MPKINLKVKLDSSEEKLDFKVKGIKDKNKIVYKENDITVTLLISDNKIVMKRVCNEYEINLIFTNDKSVNTSTYSVFGCPKVFELETKTNKLEINDNRLQIDYNLEGNDFKYILEME